MEKFWTITDSNTTHTNSRSERFTKVDRAVDSAKERLRSGRSNEVVILEAVAVVKFSPIPIKVEPIHPASDQATPMVQHED